MTDSKPDTTSPTYPPNNGKPDMILLMVIYVFLHWLAFWYDPHNRRPRW
jgi:hypothetical protein